MAWTNARRINGIILKDGKYTLRLTAQGASPGPSDPTATIIIDTVAPVVSNVGVSNIDVTPHEDGTFDVDTVYTFATSAMDNLQNINSSGVDKNSLKFEYKDANFTNTGAPTSRNSGQYEQQARLVGAPQTSKILTFTAKISDLAGNVSKPVSGSFSARIRDELISTTSGVDYSLANTSATNYHVLKDVYYSNSDDRLNLNGSITLIAPITGQIPVEVPIPFYLVNKNNPGKAVWVQIIKAKVNAKTDYRVNWYGKDIISKQPVSTGRYRTVVENSYPWVDYKQPQGLEVKVSDKKCLKLSDWRSVAPVELSLRQQAHILDGHALMPPNSLGTASIDYATKTLIKRVGASPAELFGTFDASLGVARPNVPFYSLLPAYYFAVPPYDYDEYFELVLDPPYTRAATSQLANGVAKHALDTLTQIAAGIALNQYKEVFVNKSFTNGLQMPVVLPNHRVLWTVEVPLKENGAFITIFPNHGGQEKYEKGI
jgi:hypothetical protein